MKTYMKDKKQTSGRSGFPGDFFNFCIHYHNLKAKRVMHYFCTLEKLTSILQKVTRTLVELCYQLPNSSAFDSRAKKVIAPFLQSLG